MKSFVLENASHCTESSFEYETLSSSESSYESMMSSSEFEVASFLSLESEELDDEKSEDFEVESFSSLESEELVDEELNDESIEDNTSSDYPTISFASQRSMVSDISNDDLNFFIGSERDPQKEIEALKFLYSKSTFFSRTDIRIRLERIEGVADDLETELHGANVIKTRHWTGCAKPSRREGCRRSRQVRIPRIPRRALSAETWEESSSKKPTGLKIDPGEVSISRTNRRHSVSCNLAGQVIENYEDPLHSSPKSSRRSQPKFTPTLGTPKTSRGLTSIDATGVKTQQRRRSLWTSVVRLPASNIFKSRRRTLSTTRM